MAAFDVERALITKMIETADAKLVLRNKVKSTFFKNDDQREVFTYIVERFSARGKVPTLGLLQREFPDFEPYESDEDVIMLVDELKRESMYREVASAAMKIVDALKVSPEEGFKMLRQKAGEASALFSGVDDEDITKTIRSVEKEINLAAKAKGLLGIPFMWPYLNQVTAGRERGTFTAFYARPKKMKTWVSLADADFLHRVHGLVVGYATCEMPMRQIKRRLAAQRSKIAYSPFRKGNLTPDEKKRFKEALTEIEESPPFWLFRPEGLGKEAIMELRAKVDDYGIDLLWVDGFYHLMEEDNAKEFRVITKGLKRLAEDFKIPVCGTTQANRDSEKDAKKSSRGVAFGDALAQDCDWLFHIIREQTHIEDKEIMLDMPALREDVGGGLVIHAEPGISFEQKHRVDDKGEPIYEGGSGGDDNEDLLDGIVSN
jgi:replicative DNA helicase